MVNWARNSAISAQIPTVQQCYMGLGNAEQCQLRGREVMHSSFSYQVCPSAMLLSSEHSAATPRGIHEEGKDKSADLRREPMWTWWKRHAMRNPGRRAYIVVLGMWHISLTSRTPPEESKRSCWFSLTWISSWLFVGTQSSTFLRDTLVEKRTLSRDWIKEKAINFVNLCN